MMLASVQKMNDLKVDALKFHQLEIVKGTLFEQSYLDKKIKLLSLNEYMNLLGDSLKILNPDIIIQRLFGFTHSDFLVAPVYEKNFNYHQLINNFLDENNIFQGERYVQSH